MINHMLGHHFPIDRRQDPYCGRHNSAHLLDPLLELFPPPAKVSISMHVWLIKKLAILRHRGATARTAVSMFNSRDHVPSGGQRGAQRAIHITAPRQSMRKYDDWQAPGGGRSIQGGRNRFERCNMLSCIEDFGQQFKPPRTLVKVEKKMSPAGCIGHAWLPSWSEEFKERRGAFSRVIEPH